MEPITHSGIVTAEQRQTAEVLLTVDDLRLHYQTRFGEKIHAVDGVTFELREGECLGIAGESGCGKSTLVNGVLSLFLPPLYFTSGRVTIENQEITTLPKDILRRDILGRKISIIPQGALNSLNPVCKIKHFARDVMRSHFPQMQMREIDARLRDRFNQIGLDPRVLETYPVELSGGMKQRVVIGVSTLMNPKVVIADEPTSALDVSTQRAVIEMIFSLMNQGIIASMIFITHELPLLYHIADRIAIMYAGQFVEVGSNKDVIDNPRHPYSRALMRSMLLAESGARESKPVAIPGAPPGMSETPAGCFFAPRCPEARPYICTCTPQSLISSVDREVRCQFAN